MNELPGQISKIIYIFLFGTYKQEIQLETEYK